jgi:hypothetical protein
MENFFIELEAEIKKIWFAFEISVKCGQNEDVIIYVIDIYMPCGSEGTRTWLFSDWRQLWVMIVDEIKRKAFTYNLSSYPKGISFWSYQWFYHYWPRECKVACPMEIQYVESVETVRQEKNNNNKKISLTCDVRVYICHMT